MLRDSFNRTHDYLRISLTDKCNFRCSYCMPYDLPKGYYAGKPRMTAEEIDAIVSVFVQLGIKKIRLTGGEPLIRKDVDAIIQNLSKHPVQLAITTNGALLHEHLDVLKRCNVKSVNMSLDSLDKNKFISITGRDEFEQVISNIHLLLSNDFHVKINVVLMKGVNENEISDFISFTKKIPVHVRFIEYMPFPGNDWDKTKVFTYKEILDTVSRKFHFEKLPSEQNSTDKKFFVRGHSGTFAIISSMSMPFCNNCNRLRLTADGKLKNCLFSADETDLLTPFRKGEPILHLIRKNILLKYFSRGGQEIENETNNRMMAAIGG